MADQLRSIVLSAKRKLCFGKRRKIQGLIAVGEFKRKESQIEAFRFCIALATHHYTLPTVVLFKDELWH